MTGGILYDDASVALRRKASAASALLSNRAGSTDAITVASQLHLPRFADMAIA